MRQLLLLIERFWKSAVLWLWVSNGLRVAGALLLLPLLLQLPKEDFGFYYVLLSLMSFAPLLDVGLLPMLDRAICYAMGGASTLLPQGVPANENPSGPPNYALIWKLLRTAHVTYRYLSAGLLVILGGAGTWIVGLRVHETSEPAISWLAWGLTLAGTMLELHAGWWSIFLRGMNQMVLYGRIHVATHGLRLVLSAGLLLAGAGLVSVPIAILVSGLAQRWVARRYCLRWLAPHPKPSMGRQEVLSTLRILWPNSWRFGLHLLSYYLTVHGNTLVCLAVLGLAANAEYGLSVQAVAVISSMSAVWLSVKWPLIGQLRARRDLAGLRRVFWLRLWLQNLTFLALAAVIVPSAPVLLEWLGTTKTVVPQPWLALLTVGFFLDLQFISWSHFISTENRLPFLWPYVVTNLFGLALATVLIQVTALGIGALILAPIIAGSLLNYWYWPKEGARTFQTGWLGFTFSPPPRLPSF